MLVYTCIQCRISTLLNCTMTSSSYTIMTSSRPQKRNLYWSMNVCTTSSKCGLIVSNLSRSPNSYWSRVGHQQIAKFLLSMQLILLRSETFTKCWNKNLRTAWFALGSRSSNFLISSNLICRSDMIAICSRSDMCSCGSRGGNRLKKKSLTAVAAALTAMSREWMLKCGSSSNFWKIKSTWALKENAI